MGWVGGIAPMRPLRESETRWACMFSLRDLGFGQINGSVHISKKLPLEAEEREGQLHCELCPFTKWPDSWDGGFMGPVIYAFGA